MKPVRPLVLFTAARLSAFVVSVLFPSAALSQIASPSNTAQASGNNTAPTGDVFFTTASFTPVEVVPLVDNLDQDGFGGLVEDSIDSEQFMVPLFQGIISRREVGPLISLFLEQPVVTPTDLEPIARQGVLIAATGNVPVISDEVESSPVKLEDGILWVSLQTELIEIPTTPATLAPLRRFATRAVEAGFTPSSLRLGAQLVAIGSPVDSTLVLMSSLQRLAVKPTLKALSAGIDAFNRIVSSSSSSVRAQLAADPVFIAASTALRTARSSLPSSR
jgi:hypothetical protein